MKPLLSLALTALAASRLIAGPFNYTTQALPPDLMVGLRQTGGAQEIVLNLGPVSRFYNALPGTNIAIIEFNSAQLTSAFSSLDAVGFAAFAALKTDTDPDRPIQTLWVTRKRAIIDEQSVPWNRQVSGGLSGAASKIAGVGEKTAVYSSARPAGPNNTATAVVIPAGGSTSYGAFLGNGNFGSFQGKVDNIAPADFTGSGNVLRSDFYEVRVGSGESQYLGYFEFTSAGRLSFNSAGGVTSAPVPNITSISRSGDTTTVSFTTVAGAQYTLLSPGAAGLTVPLGTWTQIGITVAGTGGEVSLADISARVNEFYVVQAAP